jgi:CIC family chloride channel protein
MEWLRRWRTALRSRSARITDPVVRQWGQFTEWLNGRALSENAILLGFAVAVGILSAVGVVLFYKAIDLAYALFYRWPAEFVPRSGFLAYRPLVTGAGFSLAWWIMRRIGKGHDGMNVPDVQLAVVRRGGSIPSRPALARTLASAVTIGSGGSAGSEGPVVVLGAALGSWLGRAFRFAPARVVVLVGCATGAAISAAFNAPLAGAFFALEEILGTLSGASFAPVVVASVVAAVVSRGLLGNHPAFPIPEEYGYAGVGEVLFLFPLLGIACGLVSAWFVRTYFAIAAIEQRLPIPRALVPWLGGALVGAMVFLSGGLLVGYGHLAVHLDVFGRMPWYILIVLALGSIVTTSITLNSGGSGGVFTPSLYVGAATGGALGVAFAQLFPGLGLHPETYALVGMGALVAGATGAPITGILLVFEMTNDYAMVLPLMLTVVICHAVARRLERDTLYSGWLRRRGESIAYGTDRDVLAGLHVADAYDRVPQVIHEAAPVRDFVRHLGESDQAYFPVVDDARMLVGVITVSEIGQIVTSPHDLTAVVVAADVARPSETLSPSDSLLEAIRKMGVRGAAALPVVEARTGRLLGMLRRSDVLELYERKVRAVDGGGQH